ncbi:MAG: ABC transporter substrate-binding protein [Spirochaetota bacterium]
MKKISMRKYVTKGAAIIVCFWLTILLQYNCSNKTDSTGQDTITASSATRIITDMAGRKVKIPAQVNAVYCAVPTAEAMLYSLAPEKMAARVGATSHSKYLNDRLKKLPVLGGWMGEKCTANLEEIAKQPLDVIIFMTDLDPENKIKTIETSDGITAQTKKPVVILDSTFTSTPQAYRIMGDILGVKERAEKLALYSEQKMSAISSMVEKIPEEKLVNVYYAEGTSGLATEPEANHHVDVLRFVRGKNVANVMNKSGQGMTPVSLEQVLLWNPDVILVSSSTGGTQNYDSILKDPSWGKINAIKKGKVYITPTIPFGWFDRPPNIMRVLGIQWLAKVVYPDYVKIDLNQEIKNFFSLFLNQKLTDKQVAELLRYSVTH